MIKNYHTHTFRCHHAYGTEEEYVLKAIERGVKTLGFSDHSTYLFPSPFISKHRMLVQEIEDYVTTLVALREKYKDKIDIHIGFEVEYYPQCWDRTVEHFKDFGIEYLILGQHYVGEEYLGAPSAFLESDSEEKLALYVDLVRRAMETGMVSYLAHPDLIYFTGSEEAYEREMQRIIDTAIANDVPLELNLLGLRKGKNYPDERFWKMVSKTPAKVILGSDAHAPLEVANPADLEMAQSFLERVGVHNVIEDIEFRI